MSSRFDLLFENRQNLKTLPKEHLIHWWGVKMFILKKRFFCFFFIYKWRFVFKLVVSQLEFLSFITIWVFDFFLSLKIFFCHNLSFEFFFHNLSFLTFRFFSKYVTIWVLSQIDFFTISFFFYNLSFSKLDFFHPLSYWVFEFHRNFHFWVSSKFELLSFITI